MADSKRIGMAYLDHNKTWNAGSLVALCDYTVRIHFAFAHDHRLNKLQTRCQRPEEAKGSVCANLEPIVRIYVSCLGIASLELNRNSADSLESGFEHHRCVT